MLIRSHWLLVLLTSSVSLLIFCLIVQSVVDRRMLRFPALIVDFCMSVFSPIRVQFMYFAALLFGTNTFEIALSF